MESIGRKVQHSKYVRGLLYVLCYRFSIACLDSSHKSVRESG